MDLVADGLVNKEIARALCLSELTVKQHLVRISMRFGVGDRAGMVGCLYLKGWFRRREPGSDARVPQVTPRQYEVLVGVARGLSNTEIGDRLGISTDTVKTHVALLLKRFGGRNRAHLVRLAVDAGVLRLVPASMSGGDRG